MSWTLYEVPLKALSNIISWRMSKSPLQSIIVLLNNILRNLLPIQQQNIKSQLSSDLFYSLKACQLKTIITLLGDNVRHCFVLSSCSKITAQLEVIQLEPQREASLHSVLGLKMSVFPTIWNDRYISNIYQKLIVSEWIDWTGPVLWGTYCDFPHTG